MKYSLNIPWNIPWIFHKYFVEISRWMIFEICLKYSLNIPGIFHVAYSYGIFLNIPLKWYSVCAGLYLTQIHATPRWNSLDSVTRPCGTRALSRMTPRWSIRRRFRLLHRVFLRFPLNRDRLLPNSPITVHLTRVKVENRESAYQRVRLWARARVWLVDATDVTTTNTARRAKYKFPLLRVLQKLVEAQL